MAIEMNPLLSVNNTSEESFESKLFNPFDFQQIIDDEGNNPVSSLYYTIDEFSCVF